MAEVSGFSMDLYCDHPMHNKLTPFKNESVDKEYYHPTSRRVCVAEAKKDGWKFKPGNITICPTCAKEHVK